MKSGQNEKKIKLFEFAQQFHVSLFSYKLLSTSSIFQFHKISTNNNNNTEEQTESESNFGLWGKKGGTVFLRKVLFVMFCLIKAAQMTGSPKCFNK